MLISVEPSKLVKTVKSTAQARPAAIKARGVPAKTQPHSRPVVDLSSSRRSRATSWSIGSPLHVGIEPHPEFVLWETITRILEPADFTAGVSWISGVLRTYTLTPGEAAEKVSYFIIRNEVRNLSGF